MKPHLFFLATILSLASCGGDNQGREVVIQDNDFPKIDTFELDQTYDIGVYSINFIDATKDKIIVGSDSRKEDLITILSKDIVVESSFGKRGNARNEFVMPIIGKVSDGVIHVADIGKQAIMELNFRGESVRQIDLDPKIFCQQYMPLDQGRYIADYKTHSNVSLMMIDSFGARAINDLSRYSDKYSDSSVSWGFLETSEKQGKIIYAMQYIKEIMLLDSQGEIDMIVKREPSKLPVMEGDKLNKLKSVSYYWGVQSLKNSFIVCCIDKTGEELSSSASPSIYFEEYSYQGKPIRKIVIDRFISSFFFDGDLLYACLHDDEKPFAIFKLKR